MPCHVWRHRLVWTWPTDLTELARLQMSDVQWAPVDSIDSLAAKARGCKNSSFDSEPLSPQLCPRLQRRGKEFAFKALKNPSSGHKDCHEFRFSIVRIVVSVSNVTSLWGHSLVLWRLWLLVVPDGRTNQPTKGQGHLLSCSGQLKTCKS